MKDKFNRDVEKAKKDLANVADDGIARLRSILERLSNSTKKSVAVAAKVSHDVLGKKLDQYNAKAQNTANKVPGGFSKKVSKYPWITITMSLALGLLLGVILKPSRQPAG